MSQHSRTPTPTQSGRFIPDKSNIWRDCCDGYYDWVKEHINEVYIHESTHPPVASHENTSGADTTRYLS